MKRYLLLILTVMPLLMWATALDDITRDPRLSGPPMNLYPYPAHELPVLTAAPVGYEPFYIDHYGRHGSRWLIGKNDYLEPIHMLEKADSAGVLTELGKKTLIDLRRWYEVSELHLGDLTDIGAEQHQGIAKRMTENFPEVFRGKDKNIVARSSVVIRCVLSMMNETQMIQAFNPELNIATDASPSDMQLLAGGGQFKKLRPLREEGGKAARAAATTVPFERFARSLMHDTSLFTDPEKSRLIHLMRQVAVSLQNHKGDYSLLHLFTTEELYKMWANDNRHRYITYAWAPQSGGLQPYRQSHLLREMISTADEVINGADRAADLRFGHDVILMPLVCLMELDDLNVVVDDLAQLDDLWQDYNIFPMACNVQMVFYKPVGVTATADNTLVKVLFNEHEAKLPVSSPLAPYCKWSDLKKYYENKLEMLDKEYEKL